MAIRYYQKEAILRVCDDLQSWPATLLVMATGTGKTVTALEVARHRGGWALMMAHTKELIRQTVRAAQKWMPEGWPVLVEMGQERADGDLWARPDGPGIVVSTVQSMCQDGRLALYRPDAFRTLITDESHRAAGATYRKVVGYFSGGRHLGITASPERGDGKRLGDLFGRVAYTYGARQGISDGFLVPVLPKAVHVHSLDFSRVRRNKGDLSEKELSTALTKERVLHEMVGPTLGEFLGKRRTIGFCVDIDHTEKLAEMFNRYSPGVCQFVHSQVPAEYQDQALRQFREGRCQILLNCQMLTEGFDVPDCAAVLMCRHTTVRGFYMQMLGRGMRVHSSVGVDALASPEARRAAIAACEAKPDCLVIDYVGNSGKHKICDAFDIFEGESTDAVRERARKIRAADPEDAMSYQECLELAVAEAEFDDYYRIAKERLAHVRADGGRWTAEGVDPFERPKKPGGNITQAMVRTLCGIGIPMDFALQCSMRKAFAILKDHERRRGQYGKRDRNLF